ncbi:uncharacterized protein BKA55DRAFT_227656 [Fusarium redolens]|uniref:Uncharacterized protein n=1 Tax=Fusarium redolens TaxID=48865 RepID=A0A9P9HWW1_FUSRE|nr:uncharacterized protein BKA55DRAFT_227656 [Fusarium redolens]KAH7264932.1 hypothetical protein BKA55DRAFT_227656 [Fusarium redolens]
MPHIIIFFIFLPMSSLASASSDSNKHHDASKPSVKILAIDVRARSRRSKKGWIHLDDESEGYDMDYKPTEYCSHHHHVSKPLKVAMFDSRELGLTRGQD